MHLIFFINNDHLVSVIDDGIEAELYYGGVLVDHSFLVFDDQIEEQASRQELDVELELLVQEQCPELVHGLLEN